MTNAEARYRALDAEQKLRVDHFLAGIEDYDDERIEYALGNYRYAMEMAARNDKPWEYAVLAITVEGYEAEMQRRAA